MWYRQVVTYLHIGVWPNLMYIVHRFCIKYLYSFPTYTCIPECRIENWKFMKHDTCIIYFFEFAKLERKNFFFHYQSFYFHYKNVFLVKKNSWLSSYNCHLCHCSCTEDCVRCCRPCKWEHATGGMYYFVYLCIYLFNFVQHSMTMFNYRISNYNIL